jgi:hypothetical protein
MWEFLSFSASHVVNVLQAKANPASVSKQIFILSECEESPGEAAVHQAESVVESVCFARGSFAAAQNEDEV